MATQKSLVPTVRVPLENDAGRLAADHASELPKSAYRITPVNAAEFSSHKLGPIRHTFDQHPLMQMPQLLELARELQPLKGCRFIDPAATEASQLNLWRRSLDGHDIDEVFNRIEEPGSWVALYNIENIPRYKDFLLEVLGAVRPLVEPEQPEIFMVTGFIFISAPPSVTPFHIDRENNFWLQIRGRKFLSVWDRNDRNTVPASAVEDFIVQRDLSGVILTDAARAAAQVIDNGPGDGMYFPSTTPHMTRTVTDWVQPGEGVSISIGVNFYTSVTRRHALVHQCNRVLRRIGFNPTPPGQSAWRDAVKQPLGRAAIQWL